MRKYLFVLLALAGPTFGICNLPPPEVDPPPTPLPRPIPETDPDPGPDPYPTPGDDPTPTPTPTPVPTPGGDTPTPGTRGRTQRPGGTDLTGTWHLWWELNREHWLGLRQTLKRRDVDSGESKGADPLAEPRLRAVAALRRIATSATHDHVRAAALRALGRAGGDEEVRLFLKVLRSARQPAEVHEGAAVGLGLIPRIEDARLRGNVLQFFDRVLAGKTRLRGHAPRLAVIAIGMRARETPALAWKLVARCGRKVASTPDASALLLACGATRDASALPVLLEAALSGRLGKRRLHAVSRSHAALGLGMLGDASAVPALVQLLKSRRTDLHTRRSAAIALGHLLRDADVAEAHRKVARHAILTGFDRTRDPLARGFLAVAMGAAHEPFGLKELRATVERKGHMVEGPYAALALGLAAARTNEPIREFLAKELMTAKHGHLKASLSIALGLTGGPGSQEQLLDVVRRETRKASVRGPAIQGVGLVGETNPAIEKLLTGTLEDGPDEVIEDTALALGLLGWRRTAHLLVDKLAKTKSVSIQVHMVAALSHLGGGIAVDPLIELLENKAKKHTQRMSAAAALGILVGHRDHDYMFEIDAFTNPFALTPATRSLVLAY